MWMILASVSNDTSLLLAIFPSSFIAAFLNLSLLFIYWLHSPLELMTEPRQAKSLTTSMSSLPMLKMYITSFHIFFFFFFVFLRFKYNPALGLSFFYFHQKLFKFLLLCASKIVLSAYLMLLIFLPLIFTLQSNPEFKFRLFES